MHDVFHIGGPHDSRPDLLISSRLVDVSIVTEPRLQASLTAARKKIGTEDWDGRYSWRVLIPLSYNDSDGREHYARADKRRQLCLSSIRALEACMGHSWGQDGSCPPGRDFRCYLVQMNSPLQRTGFYWNDWHFFAREDDAETRRIDMTPMWGYTSPSGIFTSTITDLVNGSESKPSDFKKKMERFRLQQIKGREVFFVPAMDFLGAARLDILTGRLTPRRMKRFITGVYVSAPSLGGVAYWSRQKIGIWEFVPFPKDFTYEYYCPDE